MHSPSFALPPSAVASSPPRSSLLSPECCQSHVPSAFSSLAAPSSARPSTSSWSYYSSSSALHVRWALLCLVAITFLLPHLILSPLRTPSSHPSSTSSRSVLSSLPRVLSALGQSYPDNPLFWAWSGNLSQTTIGGQTISIVGDYYLAPGACTISPSILFTFSDGTQSSCVLTYQDNNHLYCTVPPGTGTPHVTINICGQLNRDLPRMPTDMVFYVGSTPPMNQAWCAQWNNSQVVGWRGGIDTPAWFCSSDSRQKLSATGHSTPDRPLFTYCPPDTTGSTSTCPSMATSKRCISISDPQSKAQWNATANSNLPFLFCTETASPYYFSFLPNCTTAACQTNCLQILNPNANSTTTFTSGNAYLCATGNITSNTTAYPSPFYAGDTQLQYHYAPPAIANVTPNHCPTAGGTVVTLTGSSFGFQNKSTITVLPGTSICNITFLNHTYATCIMPPGQGSVYLSMTVDSIPNVNPYPFAYDPPVLSALYPQNPNCAGGSALTIVGQNFGSSGSVAVWVTIGATLTKSACSPQYVYNNTAIVCAVPAGQGANQSVYVTSGQSVNLQPASLSYLPPVVQSVSPLTYDTSGSAVMTINGTSFGTLGAVSIGGISCPLTGAGYSNTMIQCVLPLGQGTNQTVIVTASSQQSNPSGLFSYNPPNVTSVGPQGGTGSSIQVTLAGTSFGNGSNSYAYISGQLCVVATGAWAQKRITCTAPVGQGLYNPVYVNVSGQFSNTMYFSYSPVISNVSAPGGTVPTAGGVLINVTGTGFSTASVAPATVYIGASICPVVQQSNLWVTCTLPAGGGTVSVIASVVGLNSSSFSFSYDPPSLYSLSPSVGATVGGSVLSLWGLNFGSSPTATVNGVNCNVTGPHNNTFMMCVVPNGSGSSNAVIVSSGGGLYTTAQYYAYYPPVITAISPIQGASAGGYNLTVTGGNFSMATTLTFVVVNGISVSPTYQTDTTLVITMPQYSNLFTVYPVVLANGQSSSQQVAFMYLGASITSVSPTTGPTAGGTLMRINGTNFGTSGYVMFGSTQAVLTGAGYSNTYIECTLPVGQGVSPVTVTLNSVKSAGYAWSYLAPSISSITPSSAATSGNVLITLVGSNFGTSGAVTFGPYTCSTSYPGTSYSTNKVICYLPPGQGANLSVLVNVSAIVNPIVPLFSYNPPNITNISPVSGPTSGGGVITLYGVNFGLSAVVTFANPSGSAQSLVCTPYGLGQSHTQIQCTVPAFVGASVPIYANVSNQVSSGYPYVYTAPVINAITPLTAPTQGGTYVTFNGTNFGTGTSFGVINYALTFASTGVSNVSSVSQSLFTFAVPAGSGPAVSFTFTVGGQLATYFGTAFSYQSPLVTRVSGCDNSSPTAAVNCDTTLVSFITIYGSNFGANTSLVNITVGGHACTNITLLSAHTTLACNLQPLATGGFNLPVAVTVNTLMGSASLVSYAGPTIYANSLVTSLTQSNTTFAGTSGSGSLQMAVDGGSYNVSLSGQSWGADPTAITVTFGIAGGLKLYNCSLWSSSVYYDVGSRNSSLSCQVPFGAGANLTFVVRAGLLVSQESSDTLSFPPPQLVSNTLRANMSLTAYTDGTFIGVSSQGDTVYMDVAHAGNDSSQLHVFYGLPGSAYSLACSQLQLFSGQSVSGRQTIECQTQSGSGTGYHFELYAVNEFSAIGSDVYNYVQSPIISAVTGCTNSHATNSTYNCPTLGGSTITILGVYFTSASSVTVNGLVCSNVYYNSSTLLTCILPAQAGSNLSVIVTTGLSFSQPAALISYAAASITAISGCTTYQFSATIDCNRTGGDLVTLVGSNFGPASPTVLVDGNECTSVTMNSTESGLTCFTPAGTQQQRTVILIQSGGSLSIAPSSVYLSYHQCDLGSYAAVGTVTCSSCGAGTYADSTGLTACKNCAAGSYIGTAGATTCVACTPGQYSLAGATTYTSCSAGTYNTITNATTCNQCKAGTYNTQAGNTTCFSCLPGTYSGSAGSVGCTSCNIGQYSDYSGAVTCIDCAIGTYANSSTAGVSSCTSCPAGSVTTATGQTSCTLCTAGYYAPTTQLAACLVCDAGTFSNSTGATSCTQCGVGYYSAKVGSFGATTCTQCGMGTYTDATSQGSCLQCPQGQFGNQLGQSSCSQCGPGTYTNTLGNVGCGNCALGTYTNGSGTVSCLASPVGSFVNVTGSTWYTLCPAGSVQSNVQQTTCTLCPLGTYMDSQGQAVCLSCDPGTYADVPGLTSCISCPAGYSCPTPSSGATGPTGPTACATGTYSTGGSESCLSCDAGYYQNATGQSSCSRCPVGTATLSTGSVTCTQCDPGQYAPSPGGALHCIDCPIGSISTIYGAYNCTQCPVGQYSPATGSSQCSSCAAGTYTNLQGQASCLSCPAGSISKSQGQSSCSQCTAGYYQPSAGQSKCRQCDAGNAQPAQGQVSCIQCPAGAFSNALGSQNCTACPIGTASSTAGVTACPACAAGTFTTSTGQLACTNCPVGTFNTASGLSSCSNCAAGFFTQTEGTTSCSPCLTGTYSGSQGTVQCYPCAAGSYTQSNGSTICTLCGPGTYQSSSGASNCSYCPTGTYSQIYGAVSCLTCPAGTVGEVLYVNLQAEGTTSCSNCLAGTYQPTPGGAACINCSVGSYIGIDGQSACLPCSAGQYQSSPGSLNCSYCPPGTAQSQSGSPNCNSCPVGQYSGTTGASTCSNCAAGTYTNTLGNSACLACPIGQFQSVAGQKSCTNCSAGSYTAQQGLATCTFCSPGYYQNTTGQNGCVQCPIGFNQSQSGQSTCSACPMGTFASNLGQSQCTPCPSGYYQNVTGQTACVQCPVGTAQGSNGATSCVQCAAGYTMPYIGYSACTACPPGQYVSTNGSLTCNTCSAGFYSPVQGSSSCLACGAGTYQLSPGQSSCSNCARGSSSNVTQLATVCPTCPAGSYAGVPGQTNCTLCEQGKYGSTAGLSSCALCNTGSYQDVTGSTICKQCSVGYNQPSLGMTTCEQCVPGYFAFNPGQTDCTPCVAGQWNDVYGAVNCSNCPEGYHQLITGQTGCDECAAGTANPSEGLPTCAACTPGYYQPLNGTTSCLACSPGTYQDQYNGQTCLPCPIGMYNPFSNQKQCLQTQPGYFANVTGLLSQIACAAGSYQPSNQASNCSLCPTGQYQADSGQAVCSQCPAGKISNTTGAQSCTGCDLGFNQPTPGSTSCIPCSAGSYASTQGTATCPFCAAGTFSNASQATSCYKCPVGQQQPNNNATTCSLCEPGTANANEGTAICPACVAGSYSAYYGNVTCTPCPPQTDQPSSGQSTCSACSPGTFNLNSTGLESCNQCEPGTYTNATGAASCTQCALGMAQPAYGATSCSNCTMGQYASQEGSPSCLGCPAGSFSTEIAATACVSCPVGQYQPSVGQSGCQDCPAGTANSLIGKDTCTPCPAGQYSSQPASLNCTYCADGHFQGVSGQQICNACPAGTYHYGQGGTACEQCDYGYYTKVMASTSCLICDVGTYNDALGGQDCLTCNSGEFNPAQGQKVCSVCQVGTYSNATSHTNCIDCELGTTNAAVNQSSCSPCAAGYYMPNEGQTECLPCPVGTYSSGPGAQTCLLCAVGLYQDEPGQTSCKPCSAGQSTAVSGLSYCDDCPVGQFGNSSSRGGFCHDCVAGQYNLNTGVTQCVDCPAGYESTSGQQVCTACPDLTVAASPGTPQCAKCDPHAISDLTHTKCECNPGWYLDKTYAAGSDNFVCDTCPTGADCSGYGNTFATLKALAGFWRSDNETLNFYECPIAKYCTGGNSSTTSNALCADNRAGIMCTTCADGYHEQTGGDCVLCPTGGTSWASIALIALAILFLVWLQIYIVIRSGKREIDRGLQNDATADSAANALSALDDDDDSSDDESSSDSDSSDDSSDESESSSRSSSSASASGSGSSRSSKSSKSGSRSSSEKSKSKSSCSGASEPSKSESGESSVSRSVSGSTHSGSDSEATESGSEDDPLEMEEWQTDSEEEEEPHNEMERVDPAKINFHVRYGPPEPQHDFTYKLKIFLSFLQVATNLGTNLNIVWPTTYVNFLLFFDVSNFDFALSSAVSADCIGVVNYYSKYVAIVLTPPIILVFTVLFYLLPNYLEWGPFRSKTLQERQRGKMNFWRLFLYLLFLVYPSVSSTVLRLYVCQEIVGTNSSGSFLTTDLRVECYTSLWTSYTYASLILILLYPIGIPIFFFSILRVNQENLREPRIRAQLGFLYAGYRGECWWFEITEAIHKLTLTSVLAFLPSGAQLPTGMGVCVLYFLIILLVNPYLSSFDDMLALYSECEIFLLVTAGWIFYNQPEGASDNDLLLSVCLIAITIFFFAAFLFAALYVLLTLVIKWKSKRRVDRVKRLEDELAKAEAEGLPLSEELIAYAAELAIMKGGGKEADNAQLVGAKAQKAEFVFVAGLGDSDEDELSVHSGEEEEESQQQQPEPQSDRGVHERAEHSDGESMSDMDDMDVGDDPTAKAGRRMRGKAAKAAEETKEQPLELHPFEADGDRLAAQTAAQRKADALKAKSAQLLSPQHAVVRGGGDDDLDDEDEEVVDVFGLNIGDDDALSPRSGQAAGGRKQQHDDDDEERERRRKQVEEEEEEDDEDMEIEARVRREGEEEDITKNMTNILTATEDR